jgi:protein-S-isoprenylcysteine O-methyltransferase Ste14
MPWLPAFKPGLWNAWILMFIIPLQPFILRMMDKAVGTGEAFKKMGDGMSSGKGEERTNALYMAVLILLGAYSVFLPLKVGTLWLCAGLTIYMVGLGMLLTAIVNAVTTPAGRLFTRGMYRYSRHPMYLSMCMIFAGVGVASAAWVFLLLSVVLIILLRSQAAVEERGCLARFGSEYEAYMHQTPKWLGIPKSG